MPPRYAYWTILIDNKPTAFRAREQEELLPTLAQLRRTNSDVAMKWFARGRLWDSQDAEREAQKRPPVSGEKRGGDWRPGGAHKDPRDRFKKKNRPVHAWSDREASVRRDREKLGPARDSRPPGGSPRDPQANGSGWRNNSAGPARPEGPPGGGKPGGPPQSGQGDRRDRPWTSKPGGRPGGSRPWSDKPPGDAPRGDRPWTKKPGGAPSGAPPRGDRPWSAKPARPPSTTSSRGDRPWSAKPGGNRPWTDKPRGKPQAQARSWSAKPQGPAKPWRDGTGRPAGPPADASRRPAATSRDPRAGGSGWQNKPRDHKSFAARDQRPPRKRRDDEPDQK